jgi:hypothetical protein
MVGERAVTRFDDIKARLEQRPFPRCEPDDVGWLLDRVTRLTEALREIEAHNGFSSTGGVRAIARAALDTEQT